MIKFDCKSKEKANVKGDQIVNKQNVVDRETLEMLKAIGCQYSAFADYVCDAECDPIDDGEDDNVPIVFTQEWVDNIDFDELIGDDVGDTDDDANEFFAFECVEDDAFVDVLLVNECRRLSHNYTRWL